jgi:hypothetical protein
LPVGRDSEREGAVRSPPAGPDAQPGVPGRVGPGAERQTQHGTASSRPAAMLARSATTPAVLGYRSSGSLANNRRITASNAGGRGASATAEVASVRGGPTADGFDHLNCPSRPGRVGRFDRLRAIAAGTSPESGARRCDRGIRTGTPVMGTVLPWQERDPKRQLTMGRICSPLALRRGGQRASTEPSRPVGSPSH